MSSSTYAIISLLLTFGTAYNSTYAITKEINGRVISCWINDILLNIKY